MTSFTTFNKNLEKLDSKDKKIISYLRCNSNLSRKKLAKETNISESNLNYKIQRLQNKGIITPLILLNFRKLGFKHYNLLIDKLTDKELEIFKNSGEVSVILQTFGSKKVILEIITKNLEFFLKNYLFEKRIEIIELLGENFYDFNPFQLELNKKLLETKKEIPSFKDYSYNEIDSKILFHITKNPTISILGLAKETNFNRQTVTKYLNNLFDSRVIQKQIFAINAFVLGFEDYFLKISLVSSLKEKVLKKLVLNPYVTISSNSFQDILVYIQVPNYHLLAKFIEEIENISNEIKIDSFQILNVLKIENLPKVVEEELIKVT